MHDPQVFATVRDLLQKKTLKGGNDKGEEKMQLFEGESVREVRTFPSAFHFSRPSNQSKYQY